MYIALCDHHAESPFITKYLTPFTLFILPPPRFPSGNHHTAVCVLEFVLFVCLFVTFCFILHTWVKPYGSCPFTADLFHSAWCSQDPSILPQMSISSFLWLSSILLYHFYILSPCVFNNCHVWLFLNCLVPSLKWGIKCLSLKYFKKILHFFGKIFGNTTNLESILSLFSTYVSLHYANSMN